MLKQQLLTSKFNFCSESATLDWTLMMQNIRSIRSELLD